MNIPERTALERPAEAVDLHRFRLRRFVESLGPEELETRLDAVDLAGVADIFEGNPKAVLFRAVGADRQELVGNVTASRARIARAFGVRPDALLPEIQRRLRGKATIVDVPRAQAPAQEVVLTGDDADLTALPMTWPFGAGAQLETRVPEPPRFNGKRFASIEAALRDGPKFFEELMSAVGSRDGREIVRELEALRGAVSLDRDHEGRYVMASPPS